MQVIRWCLKDPESIILISEVYIRFTGSLSEWEARESIIGFTWSISQEFVDTHWNTLSVLRQF